MSRNIDSASPVTTVLGPLSWQGPLVIGIGIGLGSLVMALITAELRWLVYACGAVSGAAVLLAARNQLALLWFAFIFTLQLDVAIRFLYLHAESEGLAFPLPILVGALLLFWSLASGRFRDWRPLRWGGGLFVILAGMFLLSSLAAFFSTRQFVGATVLLTHLQLYLIFFLALNYIRTPLQLERTLQILFAIVIVQSLVYFVQSALGITFTLTGDTIDHGRLPRPGGTVATHPSGFCNFMIPLMLLAAAHFLTPRTGKGRSWYLLGVLVLALGALVLTLTRAAWAAFVIGMVWIVIFGVRRKLLATPKLIAIGFVALAVGAAGAPKMIERLSGAPTDSSYEERAALMKMAQNVIAANPLVGVGPGAYIYTYRQYLTGDLAKRWQWTVHNHYLLRTAETGIAGGILFGLFLLVGLRQAMRMRRSPNPTISATGLGWSAGIVSQAFSMYWDMWTFFAAQSMFWFLFGVMGAADAMTREADAKKMAKSA